MRGHLSDASFIDALEGTSPQRDREHLRVCSECSGRVRGLQEALEDVSGAEVPEPGPFYWASQRQLIREGLLRKAPLVRRWIWMPGLALAGAAALGFVLLLPSTPSPRTVATIPAWTASSSSEEAAIATLRGLSPAADDLVSAQGTNLTDQIVSLSDEENTTLAREFKAELGDSKL